MKSLDHRPSVVSFNRPPSYGTAPPEFSPTGELTGSNAYGTSVRMTSIMQLSLGVAMLVAGLISIYLECYLSYYAVPVWTGLLFFGGTGIVGLKAFHQKMTKGLTVAYLAMSIFCAVLAALTFFMYIHVSLVESYAYYCFSFQQCKGMRIRVIVNIVIAVLSLCEVGVAATGSSLTCCHVCYCCTRGSGVNMVYYNTQAGAGQTSVPQYGQDQGPDGSESGVFQGGAVQSELVSAPQTTRVHTSPGSAHSSTTRSHFSQQVKSGEIVQATV